MARRVFFSFDFTHDVFRANQVRMANVVGVERAGYYDHSEYEEAQKKGALAIRRMILDHLKDTTVTVVLIGTRTATRPWVRFEVEQSIKRGNGLLGVRIHHLAAPPPLGATNLPRQMWRASLSGPLPVVPRAIGFPVYSWDFDLERLRREIEAAGERGEKLRARRRAVTALYQRRPAPPPVLQPPPRPFFPGLLGSPPPASPFRLTDSLLSSLGRPSPPPGPRSLAQVLAEVIKKQRR